MSKGGPEALARLGSILEECARGDLAPNMALMRLVMEAESADEIESVFASAGRSFLNSESFEAVFELWRKTPNAFQTVKAILKNADHSGKSNLDDPTRWAAVFDHLAEISPEAGVALYSLGSPALLCTATASIVCRLREWELLGPEKTVLDLGCGMGRICAALAAEVRSVVGTDISGRMLAIARERCADHPNVLLLQTSGRDLSALASGSFDLVLAVDTFPYLVLTGCGLAQTHLCEAHRVLKPKGSLVLFNYAYASDRDPETEFLHQLAKVGGFEPVRIGTRDLAWWDGVTYHVRRTS